MNKRRTFNIIFLFIFLILLGFSGYFYYQLRYFKKANSNVNSKGDISEIINKVSRLYLVPIGEEPTIATVSDPEILKDQSFFTLSEKGDKVLIYTKSGKAVLYRPSIDKIIEVAPIKSPLN